MARCKFTYLAALKLMWLGTVCCLTNLEFYNLVKDHATDLVIGPNVTSCERLADSDIKIDKTVCDDVISVQGGSNDEFDEDHFLQKVGFVPYESDNECDIIGNPEEEPMDETLQFVNKYCHYRQYLINGPQDDETHGEHDNNENVKHSNNLFRHHRSHHRHRHSNHHHGRHHTSRHRHHKSHRHHGRHHTRHHRHHKSHRHHGRHHNRHHRHHKSQHHHGRHHTRHHRHHKSQHHHGRHHTRHHRQHKGQHDHGRHHTSYHHSTTTATTTATTVTTTATTATTPITTATTVTTPVTNAITTATTAPPQQPPPPPQQPTSWMSPHQPLPPHHDTNHRHHNSQHHHGRHHSSQHRRLNNQHNNYGHVKCTCHRRQCSCCLRHTFRFNHSTHITTFKQNACVVIQYNGKSCHTTTSTTNPETTTPPPTTTAGATTPPNEEFTCLQNLYDVTFTVNGQKVLENEVSLDHLHPLCYNRRLGGGTADVCLNVYSVDVRQRRVCTRITGVWKLGLKETRLHMNVGCMVLSFSRNTDLMDILGDEKFWREMLIDQKYDEQ